MYRLMIIDDEKSVRNLLKRTIDWNSLEIKVVGEAGSGIEAINTIDDIRPDIAFVDIRMPFMNGIEFSRLATRIYPDLKIIILSAYDDFEYARECISIGVSEYLLKPISRKEVIKAVKKAKLQLGKVEKKESEDEKTTIEIHEFMRYIEENYKNPELNLTYVARQFGFNPSYFSRKFKKEIGISFTDYLTSFRVEKAAELARQGELMYIAAEQVGIPDPSYFGKCFKKYKNISYSDYVKRSSTSRALHYKEKLTR